MLLRLTVSSQRLLMNRDMQFWTIHGGFGVRQLSVFLSVSVKTRYINYLVTPPAALRQLFKILVISLSHGHFADPLF